MEDTYRARICPICDGVVTCDLSSAPTGTDQSFKITFVAQCGHCGLALAGNKSTMFDLFSDRKCLKATMKSKSPTQDVDDKWVYVTGTYRNA